MDPHKLIAIDHDTNKKLNKQILFFLKRLKTLLSHYADQKRLDVHLPLDSIRQVQDKSLRESAICQVLGRRPG